MWIGTLWNKLLRFMRIKTTEQGKLLWTVTLTFLCGALLCYISSLPLALFLTHNGSAQLLLHLRSRCFVLMAGFTKNT